MATSFDKVIVKRASGLKPCPCCSGEAKLLACHVYCTVCFLATTIYATPEEAVRAWDMRGGELEAIAEFTTEKKIDRTFKVTR